MSKLVSIVVTVNDGTGDKAFNVDIDRNCSLYWNREGWDVLADFYRDVKKDPKKEKEVRDRSCPKAKPKHGEALVAPTDPVVAFKSISCDPTEWP